MFLLFFSCIFLTFRLASKSKLENHLEKIRSSIYKEIIVLIKYLVLGTSLPKLENDNITLEILKRFFFKCF